MFPCCSTDYILTYIITDFACSAQKKKKKKNTYHSEKARVKMPQCVLIKLFSCSDFYRPLDL